MGTPLGEQFRTGGWPHQCQKPGILQGIQEPGERVSVWVCVHTTGCQTSLNIARALQGAAKRGGSQTGT